MSPVKILVGNNFRLCLDGNRLQTNVRLMHVVYIQEYMPVEIT